MAETLLKRALNVLEYASSNYNLGDLKETRTFLQQTLSLAQEKAAKDRALRKEFSMKIASLEEEAKRFTNAGKYDDAFKTYDEAIRLIRSSSFRGEGQYQDKLEEFLNSQKELIARIKGSHLEKSLGTMEDLLAKGKVEEIRHVAVDLNLGGNDSANPKIRRILWLQHISQNVRNFFKEGIRKEAVEFFGKRYQTDVKVKVEDVSLNKIVVPDYKLGSVCFDLRMNGSAILYTEMTRKFSASPFQCEVHVRV
jgi:tetratricopeptide (TPR) repeat protein